MSKPIEGIMIEVKGLEQVALFMAAIVPAYFWARRGKTPDQVIERAAISAVVLVAAAVYDGLRGRD